MNVLELSHADSTHNCLHKRLNKVKYDSRVKAGCKPARTNPGPHWRKLQLVPVVVWAGKTPWEPGL